MDCCERVLKMLYGIHSDEGISHEPDHAANGGAQGRRISSTDKCLSGAEPKATKIKRDA
jgi:hypothetical protein